MRKRDPLHQKRLEEILKLPPSDVKIQISIEDYRTPGYVSSEVLASIVRTGYGKATGVLDVAAAMLLRRVIVGASLRIRKKSFWREIAEHNNTVLDEAVSYFFEKFFEDTSEVSNSEVRFAIYLENRVDDYMKHLLAQKNSQSSLDAMSTIDEDGQQTHYVDTLEDDQAEQPLDFCMRKKLSIDLNDALMKMPKKERNAFYFRYECNYDWKKVAELLGCSIPTARDWVSKCEAKLKEINDDQ